jgi:hypothetical protein
MHSALNPSIRNFAKRFARMMNITSARANKVNFVKETPKRRITVTSSLNGISTDQLGNRVVVRGKALLSPSPPLYAAGIWTDV